MKGKTVLFGIAILVTAGAVFVLAAAPSDALAETIVTVAGSGPAGIGQGSFSGDGDPATSAQLHTPSGVAFDAAGNLFIADQENHRVRMVAAPPPILNVTPISLNFGSVTVNSTKDLSFTVTNSGGGTLTGNVTTSAPFSIISGGSFSLGAGQSQTVTVRFSPTATGTFVMSAEVTSNAGSATVSLTGTGVPLPVSIDIKPGSFPNSINLGSGGTVPVAIFSTTTFDATTVDPTTVTLASAPVQLRGKGTPMASFEDVNGDGLLDQVVHVSTSALQLSETDTEAILEGKTSSGTQIRGSDSVRVVP